MIYIVQNALPILVATLAGLAVGLLFDRLLRRAGGAARHPLARLLPTALVAEGWFCAILAGALILAPAAKGSAWTMAIGSAVVIWIGFVAPALIVTARYRALPWRTALLDAGHWLAVMLVQAVVLQSIGLHAPR